MIRRTLAATQAATFCIELPDHNRDGMNAPTGTGFFVSADGYFVTAAHVVCEESESDLTPRQDLPKAWLFKEDRRGQSGAKIFSGLSLEYLDRTHDIAILKVDFATSASAEWLKGLEGFPHVQVSIRPLSEAEPVYSFGYPLSEARMQTTEIVQISETRLCPRVTSAIVASSLEVTRMVSSSADEQLYVLDKALNYGNSGGPVLAVETGHVHAVCTRFQPVFVPQRHMTTKDGRALCIMVPSLYSVVASLSNRSIESALRQRNVPIRSD